MYIGNYIKKKKKKRLPVVCGASLESEETKLGLGPWTKKEDGPFHCKESVLGYVGPARHFTLLVFLPRFWSGRGIGLFPGPTLPALCVSRTGPIWTQHWAQPSSNPAHVPSLQCPHSSVTKRQRFKQTAN